MSSVLAALLGASMLVGIAGVPVAPQPQAVATAPPSLSLPAGRPATVPGAEQFDVASIVAGRDYRIYVYRPMLPPPTGGYPVVYVLDGDGLFATVAGQMMLRQFGELQPALIVGVGYPTPDPLQTLVRRNHDLTPVTPEEGVPVDIRNSPLMRGATFGGAEPFRRFLVEELRPALGAAYPIDPSNQTLFGHSLGGLFALDVLLGHPADFSTYALSSPSIWWNGGAVLDQEAAFARRVAAGEVRPRVILFASELEQKPDAPTTGGRADRGRMVDNARDLAERLKALEGGDADRVRFVRLEGETHNSAPPSAISRALGFALGRSQ